MIVPMERVLVTGPQNIIEPCLKSLHTIGTIHISNSRSDRLLKNAGLKTGSSGGDVEEQLEKAEAILFNIKTALTTLEQAHPAHKELLAFDTAGQDWLSPAYVERTSAICAEVAKTASTVRELSSALQQVSGYRGLFEEFKGLVELASSMHSVEASGFIFRAGEEMAVRELEEAMMRATGGAHSVFHGKTGENHSSLLIIYPSSLRGKVQNDVFGKLAGRIQTIKVPAEYERETFAKTAASLFEQERAVRENLDALTGQMKEYAVRWSALLRTAERGLGYTAKKLRLQNFLATSGRTFWISGWIPETSSRPLRKRMEDEFGGRVLIMTSTPTPDEYPDVPVLLRNPPWARPFERLLRFFPPPVYGSVDPVISVMFFFPLFFGLILGDAGYALLLLLIVWFIRLRRATVPVWEDVAAIMVACAATSALFGALYGEFFGNIRHSFGLPPGIVDRKRDVMHILAAVIALGGVHLSLGNLISGVDSIRRGYFRHGAGNLLGVGLITTAIAGGGMAVMGKITGRELGAAIAALVIAKTLVEGPKAILEVFRLLSNILSYARLMALGMASLMLADTADEMFTVLGGGLLGIAAGLGLHMLNFLMGTFSPAIQALRLHVVEFFNQFFQYGSVRYAPFKAV